MIGDSEARPQQINIQLQPYFAGFWQPEKTTVVFSKKHFHRGWI